MDIIEFLTKNFYFILIAIFFVARLFSNSGKKGQTPGRMPDFGGEPANGGPQERTPEQQARPVSQQERPVLQQERPDTVYRTQWKSEEQGEDVFPGADRFDPYAGDRPVRRYGTSASSRQTRPSSAASRASNSDGGMIANPTKGLAKDDLRKAFIWSEVLGPPKAKRPYRRS
ncbi:hypothetical protein D3P07_06550 [Paenibacillus sp. 1011MAR3C5]|uniref:hypothetical protein n=1 Tax=Paenibacillus sp. 1011MAR3C5 TaxID=1675787 RepID=UPI000E6B877A|nr:hypothetical protein [Paenibacillus sp. 1011MAR3C5]RJE89882.1 hypothetical protein D3P07_06550 [Paenibacillus sp. 1011MAR3C5]